MFPSVSVITKPSAACSTAAIRPARPMLSVSPDTLHLDEVRPLQAVAHVIQYNLAAVAGLRDVVRQTFDYDARDSGHLDPGVGHLVRKSRQKSGNECTLPGFS